MLKEITTTALSIKAKAFSAICTFPSIIFSALIIGWAAEAAQFLVSRFSLSYFNLGGRKRDPEKIYLVTANRYEQISEIIVIIDSRGVKRKAEY